MVTSLFSLRLRCRRDLVRARWRARQIAGLLGFDSLEQAEIAAVVFEIARQTYDRQAPCMLRFQLLGEALHVFPVGDRRRDQAGHLARPLPRKALAPAWEDVPWLVRELVRRTPLNLFEELRKQNQELLRALYDVQGRSSESPAA
jgi:hypothetical protein